MDLKKNFQSKSAVNIFLKDFVNYIGDILNELMDKQIKDGSAIIEW